mgnify:CR=1 FL=1
MFLDGLARVAIFLTLSIVMILPFILEAFVQVGFQRRSAKRCGRRKALYYVLTPLTSLLLYVTLAFVFGHPVMTFVAWATLYASFVAVSNIKDSVLGEPLSAIDLETVRHLFIYPEFYVDYVGARKLLTMIAAFFAIVIISYFTEASFASHQTLLPGWAAWATGRAGLG